jgi:dCTP deaminase
VILSDREALAALENGSIYLVPRPDPAHFSSTALDLTLDEVIWVWSPKTSPTGTPQEVRPRGPGFDVKALMNDERWADKLKIDPGRGFRFDTKGQFILAMTRERVCLPHRSRIAGRVEGKSSLARLGIGVHVTAPTIHAGFGFHSDATRPEDSAQPIQLEMFNLSGLPIVLDVGMAICQLILEEVREVPAKGYQGQFRTQPEFVVPEPPPGGAR